MCLTEKTLIAVIQKALSNDADVTSRDSRKKMQGTEGFHQHVACYVKVKKATAVQKLVNLANVLASDTNLAFSIHPISTGQNWGYGSATPNVSDKPIVLLSLAALNEIKYFDTQSGLCSLQPGVTQQQLYDFLNQHNAPFMVPVTGAGPSCSVLANALERGYGITPVADHFSAVTRIEGVLPNGEHYQSSLADMDKSDEQFVDKAFKWKQGPYLDGLFTQSGNLIVTEITLSLARVPTGFDSFYLRFYGETAFERAHEATQKILQTLSGVVGGINLMDKTRVLAMIAENPQGKAAHKVMSTSQIEALSKHHDVPEWTVVGTLYGSERVVIAARKDIKNLANSLADKCFFTEAGIVKYLKKGLNLLPISRFSNLRNQLANLTKATEIMQGKPNEIALPLAYWRNPHVSPTSLPSLNPAKDGCGLLWYAPLIPAKVDAMRDFVAMIRTIAPTFNIEPMITFTHSSEFNIDSTIPILFDLSNPDAVKDAYGCLEAFFKEGLKRGYVPYRLNINQQRLLNPQASSWKTAGIVAHALDPNGVLSPTRYNPCALSD